MLRTNVIHPASGKKATSAVLFLHGVGADGNDLIGLGETWKDLLPDTEFLSPDAPFPCDMAPMGYQWFSLLDRTLPAIEKGVMGTAPILNAYIDEILAQRDLQPSQLALVGFSQGTIMSLYTAPRRDKAVAGILGYSGFLVGGSRLATEKKSTPRTFLIHGTMDDVLPYRAMGEAEKALKENGFAVSTLTCEGLGHGIDEKGMEAGVNFLREILVPAKS